jgi:hypothetical protein
MTTRLALLGVIVCTFERPTQSDGLEFLDFYKSIEVDLCLVSLKRWMFLLVCRKFGLGFCHSSARPPLRLSFLPQHYGLAHKVYDPIQESSLPKSNLNQRTKGVICKGNLRAENLQAYIYVKEAKRHKDNKFLSNKFMV